MVESHPFPISVVSGDFGNATPNSESESHLGFQHHKRLLLSRGVHRKASKDYD
jgi:hypothetical protein